MVTETAIPLNIEKLTDPDILLGFASVYGLKFLTALAIFFVGKWIARKLVDVLCLAMKKSKVEATLISFASNALYAVIVAFLGIAALSHLGIETSSLAAVIAAAGLAVGFALQGSLSNLAAGVLIIMFRPFKVGDYVEVSDVEGKVEDISIFTTKLETRDNIQIIVPNGNITSGNIINYSAKGKRRIDMVFGIGYGDDIKKAEKVFQKILSDHKKILKTPAPHVSVCELADSSVNFAVRPWVKAADYWSVSLDIPGQVKLELDKAGISIPFPQRDLHIVSDATKKKK